jgi:hypothetical protein
MAETTSHRKNSSLSVIGKVVSLAFQLLLLAFLAWILLILFAFIGVAMFNWEAVWEIFQTAILAMSSHLWTSQLNMDQISQTHFKMILPTWLAWLLPKDTSFFGTFLQTIDHLWVTCLLVTQFVVLRCQIFAIGLIAMVAFIFLGIMDGLVKREIRKFQNARESTLFFHRSKSLLSTIFFLGYFFFLIFPLELNLFFYLLVISIATGYIAQVSMQQFKKYL